MGKPRGRNGREHMSQSAGKRTSFKCSSQSLITNHQCFHSRFPLASVSQLSLRKGLGRVKANLRGFTLSPTTDLSQAGQRRRITDHDILLFSSPLRPASSPR